MCSLLPSVLYFSLASTPSWLSRRSRFVVVLLLECVCVRHHHHHPQCPYKDPQLRIGLIVTPKRLVFEHSSQLVLLVSPSAAPSVFSPASDRPLPPLQLNFSLFLLPFFFFFSAPSIKKNQNFFLVLRPHSLTLSSCSVFVFCTELYLRHSPDFVPLVVLRSFRLPTVRP